MTATSLPQAGQPVLAPFLCMMTGTAPKLGLRARGCIHFQLLADPVRHALYLRIMRNEGGGRFSCEPVALARLRDALPAQAHTDPFPSKVFGQAFVGRSANDHGFAACSLRALGLLGPAAGKVHLHVATGDWSAFEQQHLAKPGEPIDIPVKPGMPGFPAPEATSAQPSPRGARKEKRKAASSQGDDDARAP